jgi:hypothetical protein
VRHLSFEIAFRRTPVRSAIAKPAEVSKQSWDQELIVIDPVLCELERLVRTDPARRGLIATEAQFGPLLPERLSAAAHELAHAADSVGIVTGFFIPSADPPAAETDGPLGTAVLATTLGALGIPTAVITDGLCISALRSALRKFSGVADVPIICAHREALPRFSHLVALERVGPSHSLESLRRLHPDAPQVWEQFASTVRPEDYNRCFNMRGQVIDAWTEPLHELFEPQTDIQTKTIGIGDGGNEIGMGSIAWTELARRLPNPPGGKIACRIPCDHAILAGVSNWGGYALAAGVAHLKGRIEILEPWTTTQQWEALDAIVREGPAVDGVTRLAEPTVDGLPFATYIQPWDAMRQLVGLPR